jgi:hypothetical protein
MDPFARLLSHAESSHDGHEANRVLWEAREALEAQNTNVVSYEMIAPEQIAWSDFLKTVIPKLTEHFTAKGLPMRGGSGAVLSVWRGGRIYLFTSSQFFSAISEIEELDEKTLWQKINEWRKTAGL